MKELITDKMMIERNGLDEEVKIEGYVDYDVDYRYGEDDDGHMGMARTFVNDVTEIAAYLFTNEEVELTEAENEEAKEILATKLMEG